MGRGKYDTCENCKYATKIDRHTYRCKFDRNEEYESDHWCKNHESDEDDE